MKKTFIILSMFLLFLGAQAAQVTVTTEVQLITNKDFVGKVIVDSPITLTASLTTTCNLYISKSCQITTNGYILTENGPHLSTGNYLQYNASAGEVLLGSTSTPQVNAKWFGIVGDGGTTNNYTAMSAAIGSLSLGMELLIPKDSNYYKITNSTALTIATSNISIRVDGDIVSTSNTIDLFTVTGDRVYFYGNGSLTGPGTFVANGSTWASLIRFSGDDCRVTGLTFNYPPTVELIS